MVPHRRKPPPCPDVLRAGLIGKGVLGEVTVFLFVCGGSSLCMFSLHLNTLYIHECGTDEKSIYIS